MENLNLSVDGLDKVIINILRRSKQPISTYEIAKKGKFSWSTANTHCYKLLSLGFIEGDVIKKFAFGGKKTLWKLKTENSS